MQPYVIWFIAAFALVGAELMAGTFYLLVIGLGLAAGGVAALCGVEFGVQVAVAALLSVAGIVILRKTRAGAMLRRGGPQVSMDVGQTVHVIERRADGSLRVDYRGSQWDAEADEPLPEGPAKTIGTLYIRAVRGTKLIVSAQRA
jgi:membrane protein implicated in regulation of membrane protease activity